MLFRSGSLPVIEATYHQALSRVDNLVIDFSDCYYIDPEGLRWLAAAKAGHNVGFVDRRTGSDRRGLAPEALDRRDREDRRSAEGAAANERRQGEDRRANLRRSTRDRRQRSEF